MPKTEKKATWGENWISRLAIYGYKSIFQNNFHDKNH